MTTISTCDEDYLLSTSRHEERQPPQVVTVSSLDELQAAVRERDARIAFLEKELVETRLQLASVKTSEDRLLLQLAKATKNSPTSGLLREPREVSSDDVRDVPMPRLELEPQMEEVAPLAALSVVREMSPPARPTQAAIDSSEGNTIRMPLGQSISSHSNPASIRRPISYSRKRTVQPQSESLTGDWDNINPGSCASGLDLLAGAGSSGSSRANGSGAQNAVNPGSCASGLDLLAGAGSSGSSRGNGSGAPTSFNRGSCASALDLLAGAGSSRASRGSINRMLGDIGLTPSEVSLKKRKSGDVAGGHRASTNHRRMHTLAGHYHSNAGWGDAAGMMAQPQGNNVFASVARSQGNNMNMFGGVGQPQVNTMVAGGANRPQANVNNIFTGVASSQVVGRANRPQGGLFASATQPTRANMFADLINSSTSFTVEHPSPPPASGGQEEE